MKEFIELFVQLGRASVVGYWLPVLVWTALMGLALPALYLLRGLHPRFQLEVRLALLLSLPLGIAAMALGVLHVPESAAVIFPVVYVIPDDVYAAIAPASRVPGAHFWIGVLSLMSLLVAVGYGVGLLVRWQALRRYGRSLHDTAPEWLEAATGDLKQDLGIRRRPGIAVTRVETVPFTFGWTQPTVVVPGSLLDDLPALRLALLHELIHVRRHDYAWRWVERVITMLFAFHPAVWLLRREISVYREMACDDEVMYWSPRDAPAYARLLLSLSPGRVPFGMGMAGHASNLKKRVVALKSRPGHARSLEVVRRWSVVAALAILVAGSFLVAGSEALARRGGGSTAGTPLPSVLEISPQKDSIYRIVDELPEYPGGSEAMIQHFREHLLYPEEARAAGIQGRVLVSFVVRSDGTVTGVTVAEGVDPVLDREAVRLIEAMPDWKPGRVNGAPVSVQITLPVSFKLS